MHNGKAGHVRGMPPRLPISNGKKKGSIGPRDGPGHSCIRDLGQLLPGRMSKF